MKLKNIKLSKLIEILVIAAGASVMLLALVVWLFDISAYFRGEKSVNDMSSEDAITVNLDREFHIGEVDSIIADVYFSDIEIQAGTDDKILLNYSGSIISTPELKEPYLEIGLSGKTLTMKPSIGGSYSVRNSTITLTLTIPEKHLEEIKLSTSSGDMIINGDVADKLTVDTTSGSASVSGFHGSSLLMDSSSGELSVNDSRTGKISLETTSGDVQVSESDSENFIADTSSGDITVNRLASQENRLETTSGSTELIDLTGNLDYRSSSGSLKASFVQEGEKVIADTTSGDVTLTFSPDAQFSIEADTTSGKFSIDFPMTLQGKWDEDHIEGKVGDGQGLVKISTSSGDITIHSR